MAEHCPKCDKPMMVDRWTFCLEHDNQWIIKHWLCPRCIKRLDEHRDCARC